MTASAEALALRPAIEEQIEKVVEVVPGARTLLLRLRAPLTDGDRRRLLALPVAELESAEQELVTISVDYAGDDLAEVGRLTGLSADEVIRAHTGQQWTVAFCGFAPGFGYLVGEDDRLRVPRRTNPRAKVPAGAIGLADAFSGIYPREGPGGWQLIGRTAGVRNYLAVRGGIKIAKTLGSRQLRRAFGLGTPPAARPARSSRSAAPSVAKR